MYDTFPFSSISKCQTGIRIARVAYDVLSSSRRRRRAPAHEGRGSFSSLEPGVKSLDEESQSLLLQIPMFRDDLDSGDAPGNERGERTLAGPRDSQFRGKNQV